MTRKRNRTFGGIVDSGRSRNNSKNSKSPILAATTHTSRQVDTLPPGRSTNNISTRNELRQAQLTSCPMEIRLNLIDVIHTNLLTVQQRRALAAKRNIKKEVEWKQDTTISSLESIADESSLNRSTPKGGKKDFESIQSTRHETNKMPKVRKRRVFTVRKRFGRKVDKEATRKTLSVSPSKEVERKVFKCETEAISANCSGTRSFCVEMSGENRNKEKSRRNGHKKLKTTNAESPVTLPCLETLVKKKDRKNCENSSTSREANSTLKKLRIDAPSDMEINNSNESHDPLKVYNIFVDRSKQSHGEKVRKNLPGNTSSHAIKLKNYFYQAHVPSTSENSRGITDTEQRQIDFGTRVNDDSASESSYGLLPFSESPFCKIDIEDSPRLDKKHNSFESIAQAIDNDMATGNRLSLPAGCNVLTSPVDPLSLPDILEQRGDKLIESPKTILNVQDTSFESSPSITYRNTGKRKCPEIINDDLLPKGTFAIPSVQMASHVYKKQRNTSPEIVSVTKIEASQYELPENNNAVADTNDGQFFNGDLLNSIENGDKYPVMTAFLSDDHFTTKNNGTTASYEDTLNNNLRDRFIDENTRNVTTANSLLVKNPFVIANETILPHFLEKFKASNGSSTADDSAKQRIDGSAVAQFSIHERKDLPNAELFENTKNANVEELTKANLRRFNVITTVKKPETNETINGGTSITDLPKRTQLQHADRNANCSSGDNARVRKRKWLIGNQGGETPTARSTSGKIKLNRKWKCEESQFLERDGDFEGSSRTSQPSQFHEEGGQTLNCQVEANIRDRPVPNKNEDKISYSRDCVEESIDNNFNKLNSPANTSQKPRTTDHQALPAFGASNSCNIESIVPTQNDDENLSESCESSTSSSSSSLSVRSSNSSSSDSSDGESTNETAVILDGYSITSSHCSSGMSDVTAKKIEVLGTTEEVKNAMALKELEAPATKTDINGLKESEDMKCLRNNERIIDPRGTDKIDRLGNNEEIEDPTDTNEIERVKGKKEIYASKAAITMEIPVGMEENKAACFEEMEIYPVSPDNDEFEDLAGADEFDVGSNPKEIEDRRDSETWIGQATCSIENADCTNEVKESDEEDCISLFAESICMMGRSSSPRRDELSEHRQPPNKIEQYTKMKSENIETFVTANKRECTATFEEYRDNAAKSAIIFEPRPIDRPLQALMESTKVPNNMESKIDDKVDLRTTLNNRSHFRDILRFFRGHCFSWLRNGVCSLQQCTYKHELRNVFLKIDQLHENCIEQIIIYAITNRYCKFLELVQAKAMIIMTTEKIMAMHTQLYRKSLLTRLHMEIMVGTLRERGLSQEDIASRFDAVFEQNDAYIRKMMMTVLHRHFASSTGREISGNKSISANDASAQLEIRTVAKVADCSYEIASPASPRPEDVLPANETANVVNGFTKKTSQSCEITRTLTGRSKEDCSKILSAPLSINRDSYHLRPIDRVPPPKSPYGNNLWKFHLDLAGVQEGLKYRDYTHVIRILNEYSKFPDRLPHITGFYDILCSEIMLSKHHWSEILRLTVQLRSSDELCHYVYDLGIYVLTKLADTGAWIHAYDLLKAFRVYGTYNTCAFNLLAAEIYIANQRPLKALAILKQSRIIFTNTRMWQHMQFPGDKALRVSVINLLLQSLCSDYAEHALALLEFIVFDQACNIQPINVCRHVDTVARSILSRKQTSLVQDLSRLILEAQLPVSTGTFRALVNRIFHNDPILAKQLHRYATWLGSYNTAKINGASCVHMIINADWTEEETYLMVSSLIDDLYMNIGHAVGRLKARQLNVFLVIEEIPSEMQLVTDTVTKPITNAEINKRRAMVKSVLERFDPKIKILRRSSGRICKLQSASLVEYLKSGQSRC